MSQLQDLGTLGSMVCNIVTVSPGEIEMTKYQMKTTAIYWNYGILSSMMMKLRKVQGFCCGVVYKCPGLQDLGTGSMVCKYG